MNKTVVIHQPDFLSYLGFFHRLLYADLFIVLDDVQYVKGTSQSWMNRDKIKTHNGEKWLTVNVKKAPSGTNINEIELNDTLNWKEKNINLLKESYKKSPYFDEIFPYIEKLYNGTYKYLSELNMASISMLLELFNIKIDMVLSSSINVTKTRSERLIQLLEYEKATHYLSGIGAKDYHVDDVFEEAQIKVLWQDFCHPEYSQLHGDFIPYLSSIDLLFNCGIDKSREILRGI